MLYQFEELNNINDDFIIGFSFGYINFGFSIQQINIEPIGVDSNTVRCREENIADNLT